MLFTKAASFLFGSSAATTPTPASSEPLTRLPTASVRAPTAPSHLPDQEAAGESHRPAGFRHGSISDPPSSSDPTSPDVEGFVRVKARRGKHDRVSSPPRTPVYTRPSKGKGPPSKANRTTNFNRFQALATNLQDLSVARDGSDSMIDEPRHAQDSSVMGMSLNTSSPRRPTDTGQPSVPLYQDVSGKS